MLHRHLGMPQVPIRHCGAYCSSDSVISPRSTRSDPSTYCSSTGPPPRRSLNIFIQNHVGVPCVCDQRAPPIACAVPTVHARREALWAALRGAARGIHSPREAQKVVDVYAAIPVDVWLWNDRTQSPPRVSGTYSRSCVPWLRPTIGGGVFSAPRDGTPGGTPRCCCSW